MNRAALLLAVCAAEFSAVAYQAANDVGNCELRAAYTKSIDWDATLQFELTGSYDPHLGGLFSNTYTLNSDLVAARLFIDRGGGYNPVLDLGDGRTFTLLGYNGVPALNLGGNGTGSTLQLKSGTLLLPATFAQTTSNICPNVMWPRLGDSKAHDANLLIGGGSSMAKLDAQEIQLLYGTNNWIVVTNNGIVAVKGTGVKIACDTGSSSNNNKAKLATRNGIRVTDGGVLSNRTSSVDHALKLFGLTGCTGSVFEVVNGGRLVGWNSFSIDGGGYMLSFRGANTRQTFTGATELFLINGVGSQIDVTGGAHLDIASSGGKGRMWIGTSSASFSNVIHVAGTGSRLSCGDVGFNFGQQDSSYNLMEVTDGGEAVMTFSSIGRGGHAATPAKCNVLRVTNGGVYSDPSSLVVGYGDTKTTSGYACSNRLEIASGGVVNANSLLVGYGTNSWGNVVDVSGGTVNVTNDFSLGYCGQEGRISIRDAGSVNVGNSFLCGRSSGVVASNNVIEVLSGGEIVARQFTVCGTNHMIVVSNGTIRTVAGTNYRLQLLHGDIGRDGSLTVVLAGTNPVLRAEGTVTSSGSLVVRPGTTLDFRVPSAGYVAPPLQTSAGPLLFEVDRFGNVPDLRFDVSACTKGLVRCVIARGDTLQVADSVLARARANLPENCRLLVVGNELVLKVGKVGFCMCLQ